MHGFNDNFVKPVKIISGRKFSYRLRGATAEQKADLAVELMAGGIAVERVPTKQAVALTGAKPFHSGKVM